MQAPRGTRDFGPKAMRQRRALETRLRDVLATFNYHEVQTPTFEELALFEAKSGPGIKDELYAFQDKSGRDLCLRPELTAPTMRLYFSELKMEPKPMRLFYFGPCFRYDRPQAGRFREFWQLGAELIGDESPEAHAELLHLILRLVETAGVPDVVLRVGHLAILRRLLERAGVARAEQAPLMRLIDKKDLAGLDAELARHGKAAAAESVRALFAATTLEALAAHCTDDESKAAYSHLVRVHEALRAFGADVAKVRVDPTIARGLEYYTGLVFELDAPYLGAEKQLLGGGAYDLSSVFGQPPVATAGFGLGFDRTLVALEKADVKPAEAGRVDAYVAALDPESLPLALRAASQLRAHGSVVELEVAPTSLKKVLARAAQVRARAAVFIGAKERAEDVAAVKVLDTGAQTLEPLAQLPSRLAALVR